MNTILEMESKMTSNNLKEENKLENINQISKEGIQEEIGVASSDAKNVSISNSPDIVDSPKWSTKIQGNDMEMGVDSQGKFYLKEPHVNKNNMPQIFSQSDLGNNFVSPTASSIASPLTGYSNNSMWQNMSLNSPFLLPSIPIYPNAQADLSLNEQYNANNILNRDMQSLLRNLSNNSQSQIQQNNLNPVNSSTLAAIGTLNNLQKQGLGYNLGAYLPQYYVAPQIPNMYPYPRNTDASILSMMMQRNPYNNVTPSLDNALLYEQIIRLQNANLSGIGLPQASPDSNMNKEYTLSNDNINSINALIKEKPIKEKFSQIVNDKSMEDAGMHQAGEILYRLALQSRRPTSKSKKTFQLDYKSVLSQNTNYPKYKTIRSGGRHRRKIDKSSAVCIVCRTTQTSQWRFLDILNNGYKEVCCNACFMKYDRNRPRYRNGKRSPPPLPSYVIPRLTEMRNQNENVGENQSNDKNAENNISSVVKTEGLDNLNDTPQQNENLHNFDQGLIKDTNKTSITTEKDNTDKCDESAMNS